MDLLVEGLDWRRLDILVNNAAVFGPGLAASQDGFDRVFRVNVRSPYFGIQKALPLLNDGGRIVKHLLGRHVVRHRERGITVDTVSPGITRTT